MKHVKCYQKGYPRPQFVRKSFLSLDGEWLFLTDEANQGISKKYFDKFPSAKRIIVPYAYQSESSGINDTTRYDIVWYNKQADFSSQLRDGLRAILIFEGSDYCTDVWVNGCHAGANAGGYHRFSFDITDSLINGKASIVVRVEDTYETAQARGKQKWEDKRFGCWYTETTGIYKSVWVEFVSSSRLEHVKIKPIFKDNAVRFDYTVVKGKDDNLSLETIISFDGIPVVSNISKIYRERLSNTLDLRSVAEPFGVQVWSENNPHLYDVEFVLYSNGMEIDRVGSYFGFREFGTRNNFITLNDMQIYLRMTLDQGYFSGGHLTPTEEQLIFDIQKTVDLGLNGIRKHQKIEDDRFYYYCDIMGVYVWLEMPSPYDFVDKTIESLTQEWIKIVRQHSNHPSIMAYVPFNESWGISRVMKNTMQQDFTQAIYYLTKALTGGELVVSNDGWEHTRSDIITLHNYDQRGDNLTRFFEDLDEVLNDQRNRHPSYKFTFADGFRYEGQPVILSEFAGIAFQKDRSGDNWGYGEAVKDEEDFLDRLKGQVQAVYSCPHVSGFCLTQTTDVEHEVNGLMDFDRRIKVDEKRLKKIILNKQ